MTTATFHPTQIILLSEKAHERSPYKLPKKKKIRLLKLDFFHLDFSIILIMHSYLSESIFFS